MISISYIQAFRLNVGNMKTEYQYAAVLRGFFLIQLHRTTSFAMRRLPESVNRRIITEEGRQERHPVRDSPWQADLRKGYNDTFTR